MPSDAVPVTPAVIWGAIRLGAGKCWKAVLWVYSGTDEGKTKRLILTALIALLFLPRLEISWPWASKTIQAGPGEVTLEPGKISFPRPDGGPGIAHKSPNAPADLWPRPVPTGDLPGSAGYDIRIALLGLTFDPLVGAMWPIGEERPAGAIGARFFFLGPDLGACAAVGLKGWHLGPDFRFENLDLSIGAYRAWDGGPFQVNFLLAGFPFLPKAKTTLHSEPRK